MATCDDARRKTAKSKLLTAALKSLIENDAQIPQTQPENKIYILDLAANIRSMGNIPDTFEDLALQLLCDIPKQYNTIYIACDIYKNRSIKSGDNSLRGDSDRFVIRSGEVRIPADFKKFLTNGDNKERMFEVIEEVWKENSEKNCGTHHLLCKRRYLHNDYLDCHSDVEDLATDPEKQIQRQPILYSMLRTSTITRI